MANKIAVASGKGGVGKTTISAGLASVFSSSGKKTLLIDCDAGLPGLDIMLNVSDKVNFTWYDVYCERCEAPDAVIKLNEFLHLIPAPKYAPDEDCFDAVKITADSLCDNYDIIIADAPAGLGRGLMRAIKASDNALIVATADEISVKGASGVDRVLRKNGISQTRLLINKYSVKSAAKGKLLTVDEIIDKTAVQLIGIIPEDINLQYKTVYKKSLKTVKSLKAFTRISKRINGESVSLSLSQLK